VASTVADMTQAASAGARSKGVYLQRVEEHAGASRRRRHAVRRALGRSMVGPLIYGFSEDAVAAAKVIADFAEDQRQAGHQAAAPTPASALDANGVKAAGGDPVASEVLIGCRSLRPDAKFARRNARHGVLAALGARQKAGGAEAAAAAAARFASLTSNPLSRNQQWHSTKTLSCPRWTA
jgi:large subunit ribosomal protein L10